MGKLFGAFGTQHHAQARFEPMKYYVIVTMMLLSSLVIAQEIKVSDAKPEPFVTFYDDEHKQKYSEGFFLLGKKHGEWTYYYENGNKQEQSHYNNGLLSGSVLYWYDNGQRKAEGYFKLVYQDAILAPLRDSVYKEWYPNGNMKVKGGVLL